MAADTIQVFLKYRHRRAIAITQEGLAAIRRAPRNDRPAMAHRLVERLLAETAKDPQLHVLVQVALATGARAGELIGLTWAFVELGEAEGRLMFTNTKNGETRIAWLFGDALEAVRAHRQLRIGVACNEQFLPMDFNKPVFPGQWSHKHSRYGRYDYMPRLRKALKAAGIEGFRFHDLRHTALTTLARMGMNGHQLKAVSGHKSDIINRYVHLAAHDVKQHMQAMSKRLEGK